MEANLKSLLTEAITNTSKTKSIGYKLKKEQHKQIKHN